MFPPADAGNCPVVHYEIASYSYIAPQTGSNGADGQTGFSWVAINPDQTTSCGGYTPVASQTFSGSFINRANDRANGGFSNSSGLSGPITLEADPSVVADGEDLDAESFENGDQSFKLDVVSTLTDSDPFAPSDPNQDLFRGRQVFETVTPGQQVEDTCYAASNNTSPYQKFSVNGAVWNVGGNPGLLPNQFTDAIGWSQLAVEWYRNNLPAGTLPSHATIPQTMNMVLSNYPGSGLTYLPYTTHTITVTIDVNTYTVQKDDESQSNNFK